MTCGFYLSADLRFSLTVTATDRQHPLLTVVGGKLGALGGGLQRVRVLEPDDLRIKRTFRVSCVGAHAPSPSPWRTDFAFETCRRYVVIAGTMCHTRAKS